MLLAGFRGRDEPLLEFKVSLRTVRIVKFSVLALGIISLALIYSTKGRSLSEATCPVDTPDYFKFMEEVKFNGTSSAYFENTCITPCTGYTVRVAACTCDYPRYVVPKTLEEWINDRAVEMFIVFCGIVLNWIRNGCP